MTEIKKVVEESTHYGDFRVPQFKVLAAGAGLPHDVVRDVTQAVYKDNLKEIDSFELTINNWDATKQTFKYVGSEDSKTLNSNPNYRLFEPSKKTFEIQMGYTENSLTTMIFGSCTTLEPNFPNAGGTVLSGRGLNVLHQMRTKQYTDSYPNKKPSQIAREISQKKDPETHKKRFPYPIRINTAALSTEEKIDYLSQKSQYDVDFLFQLARRVGYVIFVEEGESESDKRVYFGPSEGTGRQPLRDVTYILKWGVSMMDFKPTLNAAKQVRSVTVRGFNRTSKTAISEKVTLDDPGINVNQDLLEILKACDPREEVVVSEPVSTPAQARKRALAILLERYKEFVTATGTTIGLPDMRAGKLVKIDGVGCRFSGTYFITETTHTINDSGYITKFTARREDPGS